MAPGQRRVRPCLCAAQTMPGTTMPGPATLPKGGHDFRVVGFVSGPDEAHALDDIARVASLLARLTRASGGAQTRREA